MQYPGATHAVFNQTPPLADYNLFTTDAALQEAVRREGAAAAAPSLSQTGAALGTAASLEDGRRANRNPPVLHTFNVQGERVDAIEFHPSWHALMQGIAARGYHAGPWATADGRAADRSIAPPASVSWQHRAGGLRGRPAVAALAGQTTRARPRG